MLRSRAASRHALADRRLLHLLLAQRERDVVEHAHVRVQRVVLEDHRDVALGRDDVVDDAAVDRDLAARHLLEPGDHAQRGRLPAAGRPDEDQELALVHVEREAVDGDRRGSELLGHLVERHGCHQVTTFQWRPQTSAQVTAPSERHGCPRPAGRRRLMPPRPGSRRAPTCRTRATSTVS